jgi:hypothetical protein
VPEPRPGDCVNDTETLPGEEMELTTNIYDENYGFKVEASFTVMAENHMKILQGHSVWKQAPLLTRKAFFRVNHVL